MSLISRIVSVFRLERLNRELEEEQEFHIACRREELIEDGMSPDEASRRARIEFGNRVRAREESRDAKLFGWLESTGQDLYYGFRTLRKSPSFAAVAILTLALGIGANTAIFSVVNGVLLNPLPYHEPDHIICLFEKLPNSKFTSISYPNFLDWQHMNRTFSAMAAYRGMGFTISGAGEPEHLKGEMVSAGFFEIFGQPALIGRTFDRQDDHLGAAPTGHDLGRALEAEVRLNAKHHRPTTNCRWNWPNGHRRGLLHVSLPILRQISNRYIHSHRRVEGTAILCQSHCRLGSGCRGAPQAWSDTRAGAQRHGPCGASACCDLSRS